MDQGAPFNSRLEVHSSSEPHPPVPCDPGDDAASFGNFGSEKVAVLNKESEKEVIFDVLSESGSPESNQPPAIRSNPDATQKSASRRSRHTPAEWEAVKEPIVKYYVENDCTLSTVMEIMSKPPHKFHATTKMYKTQFTRWGLEKNLTQKRVRRLMENGAVAARVRKFIGVDRIGQYLKRRKATHDVPDAPELDSSPHHHAVETDILEGSSEHGVPGIPEPDSSPHQHAVETDMLEGSSGQSCCFAKRGNRKFLTEILDEHGDSFKTFYAESWGPHQFYPIVDRGCPSGCPCKVFYHININNPACNHNPWLGVPGFSYEHGHVFRVSCFRETVSVDINPRLAVNLEQILGRQWTTVLPKASKGIDGRFLLKAYRTLRDFLDDPHPPFHLLESDRLDLTLLVEGLLEDGEVWGRIGLETLDDAGFLDPALLDMFLNERLISGIRSLDGIFRAADAAFSWDSAKQAFARRTKSCELGPYASNADAPDTNGLVFELDSTPISHISSERCTTEFSPSGSTYTPFPDYQSDNISLSDVSRHLPSHYIIDDFFDKLPEEHPQLFPVVSRAPAIPLVFGDELNEIFTEEYFQSPEIRLKELEQAEINNKLVAACRSGTLGAVITLLDEGASPNSQVEISGQPYTPLTGAVEANKQEIVRQLIIRGADLNGKCTVQMGARGEGQYTALFMATQKENTSMVQLLLELGADLNETSTSNWLGESKVYTPLQWALTQRHRDTFQLLLLWDTSYSTGLKKANMVYGESFLEANSLLDCVKKGELSDLEDMIKCGMDINRLTFEGTPLSAAASFSQPHKIRLLLNHGADVHLAALYLSRTGQHNAAKLLVKAAYSSTSGPHNVRTKFVQQYEQLVAISQSSQSSNLRAFGRNYQNYRQAWATGIRVMNRICGGKTPDGPKRLSETLAFLTVARAVTETSAGDTGDINLIDRFDNDLLRWQMVFPEGDNLSQYREAVHALWSVDLSGKFFLDLDFDDTEVLGPFKGIISRLIDGARRPLELDKDASSGLNEAYSRWRKHRREPPMSGSHLSSPGRSMSLNCSRNVEMRTSFSFDRTSNDTDDMACQPRMSREQILQATDWLSCKKTAQPVKIYFIDITGVASDLVRGVIFSIVFVFIHGLNSLTNLHVTRGFGIVERFAILVQFLGFLKTLETITSGWASPKVAQSSIRYRNDDTCMGQASIPQESRELVGSVAEPCNQWYSLLGSSTWSWI